MRILPIMPGLEGQKTLIEDSLACKCELVFAAAEGPTCHTG